ncbi:hypothetical protein YC2023_058743 [Brassica napus]
MANEKLSNSDTRSCMEKKGKSQQKILSLKRLYRERGKKFASTSLWKEREKRTRVILSFEDIFFSVCPNLNPSFRLDFPRLLRNLIVTGYKSKPEMEGKWVGRTPEGVGLVVKLAGGD